MKVNWQAFHDRSLSAEEMNRVREWLATNAEARAEYEGFQRFVDQVRGAGLAEVVPVQSLRNKTTVPDSPKRRFSPFGLAAACVLLAAVLLTAVLNSRNDPLAVHTLKTIDPVAAIQFAKRTTGMNLTVLDPRPNAELREVSCNAQFASFGMVADEQNATLTVTKVSKRLFMEGFVVRNGQKFFVVTDKSGVSTIVWRGRGLEFSLIGLTLPQGWLLTDNLRAQTAKWSDGEVGSRNGPMVGQERRDGAQ